MQNADFQLGETILISAPAGEAVGRIVDVKRQFVLIGYRYGGWPACFVAKRDQSGWIDTKGQRLKIIRWRSSRHSGFARECSVRARTRVSLGEEGRL